MLNPVPDLFPCYLPPYWSEPTVKWRRNVKLYIYDHCPFCVKARMIFGLKNIPVELNVLQNDDEGDAHPDDWSKR